MVELLLSLFERETSGLRLRPVPELSSRPVCPFLVNSGDPAKGSALSRKSSGSGRRRELDRDLVALARFNFK
jgi:hypothetical protein